MTVFNPLSLKKAHACRWSVDSRWGANCKAFLHKLAWPNHPNPGTATQYYAELRSTMPSQYWDCWIHSEHLWIFTVSLHQLLRSVTSWNWWKLICFKLKTRCLPIWRDVSPTWEGISFGLEPLEDEQPSKVHGLPCRNMDHIEKMEKTPSTSGLFFQSQATMRRRAGGGGGGGGRRGRGL